MQNSQLKERINKYYKKFGLNIEIEDISKKALKERLRDLRLLYKQTQKSGIDPKSLSKVAGETLSYGDGLSKVNV